jgi:hypothetical protein
MRYRKPASQKIEQRFPNPIIMSRGNVFSVIYAGIRSVKWPHLGVVGSILGKEMGKHLPRAVGLSVVHWTPVISICITADLRGYGQRRTGTLMVSYVPSTT